MFGAHLSTPGSVFLLHLSSQHAIGYKLNCDQVCCVHLLTEYLKVVVLTQVVGVCCDCLNYSFILLVPFKTGVSQANFPLY